MVVTIVSVDIGRILANEIGMNNSQIYRHVDYDLLTRQVIVYKPLHHFFLESDA